MKKQTTQLVALLSLIAIWAVLWHLFIRIPPAKPVVAKVPAAKTTQSETLLRSRFHRVRSEMDALYHYRTNPAPFDAEWNPFRIPAGIELSADSGQTVASTAAPATAKASVADSIPTGPMTPDYARSLLKTAVANMKIGGVVTMNGTINLTVDGRLHKEGDVFSTRFQTAKGQARTLIIGIRHLTAESVTLTLEDPEAGGASLKVRLN